MKRHIESTVVALFVLGTAMTIPGVIAHASQSQNVEERLSGQIEARFEHDATLKDRGLKADVEAGVATLTGAVETTRQREQAERLASVAGVSRVRNDIVVDSTSKGIGRKTVDSLKTGIDKSVSATETGFEKTGQAFSKIGDEVTDIWILTAVKTNLANKSLLWGIHVGCDEHLVKLRGRVPTEVWHARAVDIARNTKGVHGVVDELTVEPKS